VNIRCIVALSSEILHQLLLWSAISMKWFRKKLNSDHKPLEMHWWKGVETLKGLYKYSLAEMAHNVTAFVSFTPFESSHDECQVCTVSFFYCFVLTLSERGLYLITTLTCADLPQRWRGGSEADTCSTLMLCQRFSLDSVRVYGSFWRKEGI